MFVFVKKADIYGIIEYCWKATVGMFLFLSDESFPKSV